MLTDLLTVSCVCVFSLTMDLIVVLVDLLAVLMDLIILTFLMNFVSVDGSGCSTHRSYSCYDRYVYHCSDM